MVNLQVMAGEVITRVEEVVFLYKTQNYWNASHKEIILLDKISIFLKHMLEREMASLCTGIQEALVEILKAKNEYNEVVIGDYYENLLLPKLYMVIERLQEVSKDIGNYYEQNLEHVEEKFPDLYTKLLNADIEKIVQDKKYYVEQTNVGLFTLAVENETGKKIYLHSNGNPMTEADILAKEYHEEVDSVYRICGFGFGYLAQALASKDTTSEIIVYESNLEVLVLAMYYMDLKAIWEEKRIQIVLDENYKLFRKMLPQGIPVIHYPSIEAMKDLETREIMKNYFIQFQSAKNQRVFLEENFSKNIKLQDESVDVLKETFQGKKMLLIAGGPSLDNCMEWIVKHGKEYIVVAVGTVLRKLYDYGITPDYTIVTDANAVTARQIEGVDTKENPLLYMVTSSHTLRNQYKGKTYRILQKGWQPSEEYAKKQGLYTYQTGGSVTTTALEIGIVFGCKEILCMGMDMAYTDGATHAKGTNMYMEKQNNSRMIPVKSVSGESVYTIRNLLIYRQWIENRIKDCKGIRFLNVSDGAEVKGMENISVDIFLTENINSVST